MLRINYVLSDFDILEVTKLDQLSQARSTCDRLVLALVNDHDYAGITGHHPLNSLADRLDLADQLRQVDQVFPHYTSIRLHFGSNDIVNYFTTDELFQPLLHTHSTVIKPRRVSQSSFAVPVHSIGASLPVQHLAVG